ncbi:MAG TPA: hypothetical protein ENK48_07120 [Gammaproteobacteria bacterium]|nr:hypothetical protein [Gammaproteobacteria bacterium]
MSLRCQRSRLAALSATACLLLLTACARLPLGGGDDAAARPREQAVLWEVIDGGISGGNALTGPEYLRLMRPVAVAARGPNVFIVDEGLEKLLLYHRDTGRFRVLKDLRRLVSGSVSDIYVSPDLSYYLADLDGGRVLHFDAQGRLIRTFEDPINLGRPVAVVVDEASGYVFIADGFNDDVLVYNRAGLLSGAIGRRGDGPGRFRGITAFALGSDGYYVATRFGETRVQVMADDGRFLKAFQKDTVIFPTSIVVDAGHRAFVGDYLTNTIRVFRDGAYVHSLGRSGSAPGQFKRITDLWLDDGFLYVADGLNGRIQVLRVTPENLRAARTPDTP